MDVAEVLSGEAGHLGVRELLLGEGRTALDRALRSMAWADEPLRALRLRRSHFKPGRKLTGYYDMVLADGAPPMPVAVSWLAGGTPVDTARLAAADEELRGSGALTRMQRLWATDESGEMLVTVAPLDPAFPALGRLSDPRWVPLALVGCGAHDAPLPCGVRVIRYRPGQRHVLEYRSPRGPHIFAKLYRAGAVGAVADAVTTFSDVMDAAAVAGVVAVRPAAILARDEAILYRRVAGGPLSSGLRAGRAPCNGRLSTVGRVLRAVHSAAPAAAARLQERNISGEVRAVRRACQGMTSLRPDLGAVAAHVVDRAAEQLEASEQEPASVVHGDMKADHLLCGPAGIAILDSDRCALADPALDIGKLLADLRWWSWAGDGDAPGAAEASLLAGYEAGGPRLARARLYAALLLVKMAARRVPVASRDWGPRTAELLALAACAVEGGRPL